MTIDPGFSGPFPVTINGFFSVASETSFNELARQDFRIVVKPIPEPAALLLLSAGVAGVGAALHRRRKARRGGPA